MPGQQLDRKLLYPLRLTAFHDCDDVFLGWRTNNNGKLQKVVSGDYALAGQNALVRLVRMSGLAAH